MEASRIIKKIAQRNGTITPGRVNQVSWNETECIKIPKNPYTDKVADVTVATQEQFPQTQNHAQKESDKDSTCEFGLDFRDRERAYLRL